VKQTRSDTEETAEEGDSQSKPGGNVLDDINRVLT